MSHERVLFVETSGLAEFARTCWFYAEVFVETSGLAEFARTCWFYAEIDYTHEARIREFYQEGEDKIVFWKALAK